MVPGVFLYFDDMSKFLTDRRLVFQRKPRAFEQILARETRPICFTKTRFSENVKSSGGMLLGDLNVKNKELRPELKNDTDSWPFYPQATFCTTLNFEKAPFPRVNQ
jgi:hypothetical protein